MIVPVDNHHESCFLNVFVNMRVTSAYFLNIYIYVILLYKDHERVATPSSSFPIHIYLSLKMYFFTLLQLTIIIHYFLHPNGD